MKQCGVEGCEKRFFAKGLCQKHYIGQSDQEWRKAQCAFDGCDRNVHSKKFGLCSAHYQQRQAGKELRPIYRRPRESSGGPCKFPGCRNADRIRGYCSGHDQQLREGKELSKLKRTTEEVAAEIAAGVNTCSPGTGCGRTLPLDHFHSARRNRSGVAAWCKECTRSKDLFARYKITLAEWNALFESQGRACAICRTTSTSSNGRWMTDHNHSCCPGEQTCGKCTRAILCHDCNITVGYIENHPNIEAALDYVKTA
jgi:hypothetical protein